MSKPSKNNFRRSITTKRPIQRRFIIATEGEKTEFIYFDFLRNKFKGVIITLLPAKSGNSSPNQVLKEVLDYSKKEKKKSDSTKSDQFWMVIDHDNRSDLADICQQAENKGVFMAISEPCFEFWLLLHQENPPAPTTVKDCEKHLVRLLGSYDKNKYDVAKLIANLELAIAHAQRCEPKFQHYTKKNRSIQPHSSLYRLLEQIIQAHKQWSAK